MSSFIQLDISFCALLTNDTKNQPKSLVILVMCSVHKIKEIYTTTATDAMAKLQNEVSNYINEIQNLRVVATLLHYYKSTLINCYCCLRFT